MKIAILGGTGKLGQALEVAGHLERMTALLLSINKANKVKESGIKITGI